MLIFVRQIIIEQPNFFLWIQKMQEFKLLGEVAKYVLGTPLGYFHRSLNQ
jgi:hypothetical protein